MAKVYVCGKAITYSNKDVIGKGGEADVFNIGGGIALKLFKQPDHPDLQVADPLERRSLQAAATARLATHQRKLRVFPHNLPAGVISPLELAYCSPDASSPIVGYTMPYLDGAEMLFQYGRRQFRESATQAGLDDDAMRDILVSLHGLISALHREGVVVGDFNDLNVLVKENRAYLVDADSFQYGGFLCNTFQYRFVDPLLCEPTLERPELRRPHNEGSDWYAFAAILMRCLLYVEPYGGIYRPADPQKRMPDSARSLHRITVFSPDVQYPKPALPLQTLPDDLLHYFHETFQQDKRAEFPLQLLAALSWTRCVQCGARHARAVCSFCNPSILSAQATPTAQTLINPGRVSCVPVFRTGGAIVKACMRAGRLCWLYSEAGELLREDGSVALRGNLPQGMQVDLGKEATYIGKRDALVTLAPGEKPARMAVDSVGTSSQFAANSRHLYWIEGGRLYRDGAIAPFLVGDVLPHQTRFWVGDSFGFGFYSAGGLSGAMLFDAERAGINDGVALPLLTGQILDADCLFGDDRCWLFLSVQEGRRIMNHCTVIMRDGSVAASHTAEEGSGSWLGALEGKCAAGKALFAATDQGIARIEVQGITLAQTRLFADTEPYVNAGSNLLAGRDGLYVVSAQAIHLLKMA